MQRMPRIAIIGAGMSGLAMGVRLRQAGIDSFTIYEKGPRVGGTWRDNTYPGVACDVPSYFYQFSFAPNPDWSRFFSSGAEIEAYLESIADRYDVRPHIRLNTSVVDATFEDPTWNITLADGSQQTVDFVVSATGILRVPQYPDIAGLDDFEGAMFHSAAWDHSVDLSGKRVGIIGTGSTAVQVVTALQPVAEHVTVFQRTAQWVVPVPNAAVPSPLRAALRTVPPLNSAAYRTARAVFGVFNYAVVQPGWQRDVLSAAARWNLGTIKDPVLRDQMTPDYLPMCKRLVMSAGFYPAMQQPNVSLVTESIHHVTPEGVCTREGTLHDVDVLVLATGFDAHAFMRPLTVTGRDGMTLEKAWAEGPRGYKTVALPSFPNFFMLMGPHSPVGNTSLTVIAESQAAYITAWIQQWQAGEFDTLAPTEEATARFNSDIKAAMPRTIWASGCTSWYLGKDGTPELWPWVAQKHGEVLAEPDPSEFAFTGLAPTEQPQAHEPRLRLPRLAVRSGMLALRATALNPAMPLPHSLRRSACDTVGRAAGGVSRRVRADEITLGTIPTRRFAARTPACSRAVIYLHGGGFTLGSVHTHGAMVAGLAARLDIPVYLVRYRRAPEHAYPAAVDDALAAYRGLVESGHHPQDVAIVGDSAGGGLALALAQRLTREGLDAPGVLGLMSPWLDLTLEHAEAAPGRRDPLLTLGMLRRWADSYARSANRTLAGLSPIFGELKGLPPIVVHTGTDDLMYWDAQRLEELAGRVGTVVHRHVHDRAPHVPQLMAERTAQSSYALDELACDLTFSWQTRGQWPH